MVLSLAMGFAVIVNLVATSRYEFYPFEFITGIAFAVGIAMVVGTLVFLMGEPRPRMEARQFMDLPFPTSSARILSKPANAYHYTTKVPASAGA